MLFNQISTATVILQVKGSCLVTIFLVYLCPRTSREEGEKEDMRSFYHGLVFWPFPSLVLRQLYTMKDLDILQTKSFFLLKKMV